jgi:hypothetical protein
MKTFNSMFLVLCLVALLPAATSGEAPRPQDQPQRLDIIIAGSGVVSGPGIECTGVCSYFFTKGSRIILLAEPADEWRFAGWDGCGREDVCEVILDRDTTAMAIFVHP